MFKKLAALDPRPHLSGGRLLLVSGLVTAAVFGTRPLTSYRALALDASVLDLGVIASSFAVFALLASIPVGRAVDRFGQRRAIVAGCTTVAAGCLLAWVAPSIPVLAVSQAVLGLGQLTVVVAAHAAIATNGPLAARDRRIGTYMTVASLGQAIGPFLSGLLADPRSDGGPATFLALATTAALLAAAVAATLKLAPGASQSGGGASAVRPASIRRALRQPSMRSALVGSIALLAAIDLLIAYLPLIGEERGIPPATIGLLLGTLGLAQMVARLFIGPILRVLGHARLLIVACAVPAVLIPLLAVVSPPLVPVALTVGLVAVTGVFLGLGQPVTVTLVALTAEPGGSGLAMSMRMAANRLGQTLIPIAAAGAAGRAGAGGIFVIIGIVLGGAVGYIGWQDRNGRLLAMGHPPSEPVAAGGAALLGPEP